VVAATAVALLGALGVVELSRPARTSGSLAVVSQDRTPVGGAPAVVVAPKGDTGDLIVGSGRPATKDLAIADFENLQVVHPFRVEVIRSDRFGVTVTADDNVIDHVQALKTGSTLRVALEDGKSYRLKAGSLKVKVAMPALAEVGLSHGARGTVRGFKSDRGLKARATHGSELEGEAESGDLALDASHGSTLAWKGKGRDGRLAASHGSTLILSGLALRSAEVATGHGSTARLDGVSSTALKAAANHGSTVSGSVETGDVTVKAGHGSKANLKGTARGAVLEATHGSRLALGGLALDKAEVSAGYSSSATVNARESLDYRVDRASSLRYVGKPKVGRSVSSPSSSARSISAEEAAKETPAASASAEPPKPPRRDEGEIFISTVQCRAGTVVIGGGAAGAIVGSGKMATRDVALSGFNTIEAECPCAVEVTRADTYRVSLTADDNVVDRLKAVKEGETLRISLERGNYQLLSPMKVTVTMPAIRGVTLGGAARARLEGFDSDQPFRARLAGAARLEGSIKAGDVGVDAEGASRAALRGAARAATLKANGASRLELNELPVGAADVTLTGASRATLNVRERLGYSVSGASNLEYAGDPKVSGASRSGVSRVSRAR
jgi:hypothetical protein